MFARTLSYRQLFVSDSIRILNIVQNKQLTYQILIHTKAASHLSTNAISSPTVFSEYCTKHTQHLHKMYINTNNTVHRSSQKVRDTHMVDRT